MSDMTPDPGDGPPPSLFTSRRRERRLLRSRHLRVAGVVVVLVAAGTGGWFWWRHHTRAASEAGVPSTAADVVPGTSPAAAAAPQPDLPTLDASDDFVRKLVSGLSARPQLASWLATDKLVHRFVVSVVDVANGKGPEDQLGFLEPKRPFRARKSGDSLVVDPASYRRYDALTTTFVSLDSAGVAKLYRELSPLLEQAYQDLGLNDGTTFQSALARAFGRLLAVSFPDRPPALVHNSVPYAYASPDIETQSAASKDLLRFGPDNGRKVQAKLRDLASAMGVVPVAPAKDG